MSAFPFSHRTPLQRERGKESSGIINERWMSDNFEGEFISLHFATRIYLQIHQIVEGLPVARRQTARWTLRSVSAPELSPLARLGHALPPSPLAPQPSPIGGCFFHCTAAGKGCTKYTRVLVDDFNIAQREPTMEEPGRGR